MKKIFWSLALVAGVMGMDGLAAQEAYSRAITNGGFSRSSATSLGGANVRSLAANNFGHSESDALGINNADVRSRAITHGGRAISTAQGIADPFSHVVSRSGASSLYGNAEAHDIARAQLGGVARSRTDAVANRGDALGFGRSHAVGDAISRNRTIAETFGGRTVADGRSYAEGLYGGFAESRNDTLGFSGPGRYTPAIGASDARAYNGGHAISDSLFRSIR